MLRSVFSNLRFLSLSLEIIASRSMIIVEFGKHSVSCRSGIRESETVRGFDLSSSVSTFPLVVSSCFHASRLS
jgi:hypothetical protein